MDCVRSERSAAGAVNIDSECDVDRDCDIDVPGQPPTRGLTSQLGAGDPAPASGQTKLISDQDVSMRIVCT